jgi:hypothetical protein
MFRRALVLFALPLAISGLVMGQDPATGAGQAKPSDQQTKTDSQAKPAESNVFVLKPPEMPSSPQTAPQLRAVDLEKRAKLNDGTKMQLIQLMDAEFARVRKYFPLGDKSLVIDPQGRVSPADADLFLQIQSRGAAANVGDRVQITNVVFREKTIYLELNGGPKKKTHWYQHISMGVGGAGGNVTPIDGNEAQPTGAAFTLQFNKQIPQMTAEDLRKLLSPVLDFSEKTASEVYTETLPPKVKEAIKSHEVLVGMNRDMVILAKDRPPQKIREKDDQGKEYEEWIYGVAPQDVVFVRLIGDEVTQVKTARMGGQILVKTEKEVDVKDGVATLAALKASNSPQDAAQQPQQPQQPAQRPTLRREGDAPDPSVVPRGSGAPGQSSRDDPEWGTDGKQKPQDGKKPSPPQDPPKPQ